MKLGWGKIVPALSIGIIAGVDNIAVSLAIGALLFAGPLAPGMGLGVGVALLGGGLLALFEALRSTLRFSISHVQETTIAILAAAIVTMTAHSSNSLESDIATAVAIIGASSLTTGIVFWLTGRFNLGGLVRYLPYPAIAGFLAGTGWLLVDGGINMLTGHGIGPEFFRTLADSNVAWKVGAAIAFASVMYLASIRFKHAAILPLVMAISAFVFYGVLWATGTPVEMARALGHLPQMNATGSVTLPSLSLLYQVDWQLVLWATPTMLVIAGLSMVGLILNASGLELVIGRDIDVNSELKSSGIANVLSGSVGGPSGFLALSLTMLAEKSGVGDRLPGLATALVTFLGLFLAGSLVFQVPIFLPAGFFIFLGATFLIEWYIGIRNKMPFSEWLIVTLILLSVILIGFMEGLVIGLLVSSAMFVFKYSRLPIVRLHGTGVERRSTTDRSPADTGFLTDNGDSIEVVQLQGYIFFGTAGRIVDLVRNRIADTAKKPLKFILLDFQNVRGTDSAAISSFVKIRKLVEPTRIVTIFTHLDEDLKRHLEQAGIDFENDPLMQIESTLDEALEMAEEALLSKNGSKKPDKSLLYL
jgi:SulP family sulfate permease